MTPDRRRAVAILVLHATVFGALTWWSWRKWPDPIIDFGRELYVPWEITRGQVLYRDIASLFGPLSPYLNALWFRLFGDSLRTLAVCNLTIFAAIVAGIYHIVRTATDRLTATAAGLTTLLLFGFSQYVGVGNYNFVTPYAHEATHGLALCVAMVICLHRTIASGRPSVAALAGLSFGSALLTKPEIGLAALATVAVGWTGAWFLDTSTRRQLRRLLPAFAGAAAIPPLLFFIYFSAEMPIALALRGVAGAWVTTFAAGIASNEFYRRVTGLDHPWLNLVVMLRTFAGVTVYFAVLVATCWMRPAMGSRPPLVKRLQQIAILGVGILFAQAGTSFFALPLVCVSALAVLTTAFARARVHRERALRLLLLAMWSTLSLVLLAKIGLVVRIVHYGFYLALPATITGIVLIFSMIPQRLHERASPLAARTFRQIAVCLLAAAVIPYVAHSYTWYRTRTVAIGSGADRFWASNDPRFPQGIAVQRALADLTPRVRPDSRLAVLPEGVMINYLLRRDSPLRVINLMPPEIMAFGEDDVVRSLEAKPPDFVVLMNRDAAEYGYPRFGTARNYGQRTIEWVNARYRVVSRISGDPKEPSRPAIQILERTP